MFRLFRYLKQFKIQVIFGPIFKLTEAVFELIVPLVMAQIIDVGIKNNDSAYVWKMGGIMVLLGVVGLGCSLVCQYMASKASQGFGTTLRRELYHHINTLSHAEIDNLGTSSLITRITNDINQLQVAVAMLIRLVVRAPFLVIGATIMAFSIDAKLSCIFLAAIPFIVIVLWLVMGKSIPFFKKIQGLLDKTSLITRENLIGARAIRAFCKQDVENKRFSENADQLQNTAVRVGKISALLNPLTYVIMNLAIVAIVWFGGIAVNDGSLSQGQIIALVNYMTQILLALVVVANLVIIFTKSSACAARVNEVFDTKPTVSDVGNKTICTNENATKIKFEDVSFSYHNNGENAIENISFELLRGQTLGIIGGTGCGKSTIVNLIPRFYNATSGNIFIDGENVNNYPFAQLRKQIGLVPQKAVLFSGTLRKNMQWGNESITDEEIETALKTAQAADFADKLPEGLDTIIMQGGKNLSGGQKQRLTIARALALKPQILILDDSASALDFATDSRLRKALREDTENMTLIIVSQRANTVREADKILVLDDGKMVGLGTHSELITSCAEYCEICLSQYSKEELEREVNENA